MIMRQHLVRASVTLAFCLVAILLLTPSIASAASCISEDTGNWSGGFTCDGILGQTPTGLDEVTILSGHVIIVDIDLAESGEIAVQSGATLTIGPSYGLVSYGNVTVDGALLGEEPEAAWPNPVQWRHQRVRKGDRLPRDGSESEIQRLFAAIDDERDYAMFGLMVGAGLRVGEVTDLQCSNVETPPVAGQASRLRVVGKGRKERIVWLTPQWYRVVKAWMAIRPALTTPELFLNQHGRPLSVAGVQYRLKEYCKRARVNLSCHRLRHTFARRLAEQRMPIESILVSWGILKSQRPRPIQLVQT